MKKHDHTSPSKFISEPPYKVEENHVTHKQGSNNRQRSNFPPKHQFTPLIDSIDKFLNALLDENLIELPTIIESKFPNGVASHFHYEEFCNYHKVPSHLTQNCKALCKIIHYFIE